MTKLIAVLMLAAVLWGGWQLFFYWEKVQNNQETEKKQAASAMLIGEGLSGMPYQLETSLQDAKRQGVRAFGKWLKTYGPAIQDPRKAWIQLDYCVMLSEQDPAEARRLFAEIKERTPHSSPVWPRIEQLAKTYQ